VDPVAFRRAIVSRRDSYAAQYEFNDNQRFKKLQFAMHQRNERAIEELVHYISWGDAAVCVVGDSSKMTVFRGSTPGGPVKKIKRLMVKKGLCVFEENEAYSTKSSVCCHGHENASIKNGHSVASLQERYSPGQSSEDASQSTRTLDLPRMQNNVEPRCRRRSVYLGYLPRPDEQPSPPP